MLQRRMASSIYAVRRTLERMRDRRQKILDHPEAYRREQIDRRVPDDFDDMTEEEQQQIIAQLEDEVLSVDPAVLRDDIARITKLIEQARALGAREIETELNKLHEVLTTEGVFSDPKMKLLVFTEHKDTLDYLVADGRDGRPVGKLREWGLTVTQIHGGMKIGDRDTAGSRICAEREFKEAAQVLVATEAAGEGINLQFCWMLINFDILWNPVRLKQRVGRIHRYGQRLQTQQKQEGDGHYDPGGTGRPLGSAGLGNRVRSRVGGKGPFWPGGHPPKSAAPRRPADHREQTGFWNPGSSRCTHPGETG